MNSVEEHKKFAYYPGCSLKSSAAEYDHSAKAVLGKLGVELVEIPGWTCCGATSAHSLSHDLSIALPYRNLALAEPAGLDIVAPCASCYNRLKVAESTVLSDPAEKDKMDQAVERSYGGKISTLNILEVIVDRVGIDSVMRLVVKPLSGLKVVSYYGCLLARPPKLLGTSNPDNPVELDDLMAAVGAESLFWSYKTDCCGAGHAMARSDIVITLVDKLRDMAIEAGAEAFVTACPMCQTNLDMRQTSASGERLPVFFFTELMALAMGMKEAEGWLSKHIVSPFPLLKKLNII